MVDQVGGNHYQGNYQAWDAWTDFDLNPLVATALKYVVRYKQKNGKEDLQKAISFLEKFKEDTTNNRILNNTSMGNQPGWRYLIIATLTSISAITKWAAEYMMGMKRVLDEDTVLGALDPQGNWSEDQTAVIRALLSVTSVEVADNIIDVLQSIIDHEYPENTQG